ncbi:MAG: glycosyltransferase [Steroidobacteraceae bacterium]
MSAWRGKLDVVTREWISGWAYDEDAPDRPVRLRIVDNRSPLAEVAADAYREDLHIAGIGDGSHAFAFAVPSGLSPERRHLIEVIRADDGRHLPGSPWVLEAALASAVVLRDARPAAWRGKLEIVTRERIEGWAWDERCRQTPLALVVLRNGEVIARVLANRFRDDLQDAGIGEGRHAFSLIIPGGFSPLTRQVIQVVGEADGCEIPGSPVALEPSASFDPALEQAVSGAVAALVEPAERARVLAFLAAQTERLLQDGADAASGREARLIRRQYERRWGKVASAEEGVPAPRRRALVIDELVPVTGRDAGSSAILSHMRALAVLGYEVSFVAADQLSPPPESVQALEAQSIECCRSPYYASVEEVLRRQTDGFEVIYLHRVSNASKYLTLARAYCAKARIVYSVADLHHVRVARQAKLEGRSELLGMSRALRMEECMAAAAAHAVLTHSPFEAAWLRQVVKDCNVHVVPWAVPVRPTTRPWSERRGIAFVGYFSHSPNADAARHLIEEIMPRVRCADATIECSIVGAGMPAWLQNAAAPGVVPLGYVPDLDAVYQRVRLAVAPLRYGAGVKGKVLESLAAGVPCVMSPIAAEGLRLPAVLRPLVAADAERMAALIVRLHSSEADSTALAKAGLAFIAENHSEPVVAAALKAAIEGPRRASVPVAVTETAAATAPATAVEPAAASEPIASAQTASGA